MDLDLNVINESADVDPDLDRLQTEELQMSMGPQHPSTHGVLRMLVRSDGEIVHDAKCFIGYLHRCFEKHSEALEYKQIIPYADRMDYVSAITQEHAYCLAVEKLMGDDIGVPERAEYIRVICAELQRIASHLLSFGTFGMEMGNVTAFLHGFRERERVLDLLEMVSGARLLYHYLRIGGVMQDPPDEWFERIYDFCDYFEPRIDEYNDLITYNQIFIKRTAEVGVLPPEIAVNQGATGPVLRASGIDFDTRVAEPYSVYDEMEFDVPVGTNDVGVVGDSWNRYYVRIQEMEQSVRIIRQALDACPEEGQVMHPAGSRAIRPDEGSVYCRTESARGELGFYIRSDGTKKPARVKSRPPAFCNLSALTTIAPGAMIPDLIAILGSLDPVFGEVDR